MSLLKLAAIIFAVGIVSMMSGCNNTANENANTNGNSSVAQANANTAAPANANSNSNRRKGPTREEYEKDKEKYAKEAKQAGRSIGTGLNDGWLWVKVRYELAAADDLADSTINVDVNNGVVTLSGTVPTAAQKVKAEQIAKSVEGVTSVKNQITVAPATNKNANANGNRNANANANRPKPK